MKMREGCASVGSRAHQDSAARTRGMPGKERSSLHEVAEQRLRRTRACLRLRLCKTRAVVEERIREEEGGQCDTRHGTAAVQCA